MKTRITELFGIEYPIVLSGMSWISTPEMVAAVANAGGLGILATGVMNLSETRKSIQIIRELTDKPFGANVPLYVPGALENVTVLLEEKIPIINYSLGKGDWIAKATHEYGGKIIATVTNHKHALSAQKDGADALIVTGHEAAAHGGEATSLVLVPSIIDAVDIPVIAAGGFADGRGLLAALSLGAEAIAMGTRFMSTKESPIHENMKKMSIEKGVYDTIYSDRFDGLPCRVVKEEGALKMMRSHFNPFSALIHSREVARELKMPWIKIAIGVLFSGYTRAKQLARMVLGFRRFQMATFQGDIKKGMLPLGQSTGLINDTPSVSEVIAKVVTDALEVNKKLSIKMAE